MVPTLTFERLFAFLVLSHGRRQLLWFEVTRHPTAEWLASQITEAFPWTSGVLELAASGERPDEFAGVQCREPLSVRVVM